MKTTLLITVLAFASVTNYAANFKSFGPKSLVTLSNNSLKLNTLISASNNMFDIGLIKISEEVSDKNLLVLCTAPEMVNKINLIDFTANENNLGVKLNWETQSEINTSKFELQRSGDGVKFETINIQNTKAVGGNSDKVIIYNYVDKTPQDGTIYYRLKTIYKDESTPESDVKIVSLNLDFTNTLIVYPCVVTDELNMRWRETNNEKYNLAIYDVTGEMVLSCSKLRGQSYTANISQLNSGVHILKIKDVVTDKLIAVRKFIKK